ncbi:hypothetical protein [Pseudoramibacter alactolyticus]|uniref:hypothetical protein n=1 Tax=Pseudoramibacter alactolyticus TaxID=113287 RepID=UPI0028E93C02|nr:hypothetical protein [Pseudoramibacter alactolyticus]
MLTAIGQQFVDGFAFGRSGIGGRMADGDERGNRLVVRDVGGRSEFARIEDPHDDSLLLGMYRKAMQNCIVKGGAQNDTAFIC